MRLSSSRTLLRSIAPRFSRVRASVSRPSFTSQSREESVAKLGEWFTCREPRGITSAGVTYLSKQKKDNPTSELFVWCVLWLLFHLPPEARAWAWSPVRCRSPGSQSRSWGPPGWRNLCGSSASRWAGLWLGSWWSLPPCRSTPPWGRMCVGTTMTWRMTASWEAE